MIEKKGGFLVDRQSGDVIKIESIQSIYKYSIYEYSGANNTVFGISINFKKGLPVTMQYETEHLREQAIREIIDLL